MARKIIYKENGLQNQSDAPIGYRYVGYDGVVFSEKVIHELLPIGGSGSGGECGGTNYVCVKGTGTSTENGLELEEAYVTAKGMSPADGNEITVVVYPGEYGLSEKLVLDTEYINLVSLTGNRDVILDRADVVGDPFNFDSNYDIAETSDVLLIGADYVYVKGMVGKLRNSPNYADMLGAGNPDYILPIQVGDNLANIVVENCIGGFMSFGGDETFGLNPIEVSGTFKDCTGGKWSFGSDGTVSGTFVNCTGGNNSFGSSGDASGTFTDCTGGDDSFGYYGIASGTFTNCIGGESSFGYDGDASGIFVNCTGGWGSLGSYGDASGTFTNCKGSDYSFGSYGTASGTFTNCIGGVYSFGHSGTASGTFTNCIGGDMSFGGDGTLAGQLYYCRLTAGSFQTVSGTGRTYYCVDGNRIGNVNNQ